jgi:predicted small secreted protein
MFKKIISTFLLLGVFGTITGCNTMEGFGRDVERGGEKIQDKAAR